MAGKDGRVMRIGKGGKVRGEGKEGGTWILDSCSAGSSRPCWVEVGSRGGYRGVVIVWWKRCGCACGFTFFQERQD